MRLAICVLGAMMFAPYCGAQESAYPESTVAYVTPDQSPGAVLLDPSLPPPAVAPSVRKGSRWMRLVPSDRMLWLLSYMADTAQYAYNEVDVETTTHIKSGKGMRQVRLAARIAAGTGAMGAFVSELHRGRHAKKKR